MDDRRPWELQIPHERRGALIEANRSWHEANGTYTVGIFIGVTICLIGVLILAHYLHPTLGMLGAIGVIGFTIVTPMKIPTV